MSFIPTNNLRPPARLSVANSAELRRLVSLIATTSSAPISLNLTHTHTHTHNERPNGIHIHPECTPVRATSIAPRQPKSINFTIPNLGPTSIKFATKGSQTFNLSNFESYVNQIRDYESLQASNLSNFGPTPIKFATMRACKRRVSQTSI